MKTLALDCSGETAAIALLDGGDCLLSEHITMRRGNGGGLFRSIKLTLESFGKPDRIVAGLGPGSFSGIRVAVSTAVGLKLATGALTGGLPSIAALDVEDDEYLVTGDIRQGNFFLARISNGFVLGEIEVINKTAVLSQLGTFPCYTLDQNPVSEHVTTVRVSATKLAHQFSTIQNSDEKTLNLQPLYLKPVHVTVAGTKGSLFRKAKES